MANTIGITVLLTLMLLAMAQTEDKPNDLTGTCDVLGNSPCAVANKHEKEALRFVMVGMTGTGKSATGNSIVGLALKTLDMAYTTWNGIKPFLSRSSPKSVTAKGKRQDIELYGRNISLVDTPGLFDTRFSVETTITELLTCTYLISPGPHAILLVVKADRQTNEVLEALDVMKKVFGKELVKHLIVVFTYGDSLRRDGSTIEDFVEDLKDPFKLVLQEANNRFVLFDNTLDPTSKDNEEQVRQLIAMADSIVESNHGDCYRNDFLEESYQLMQEEEKRQARELEEERKKKEELERKAQENEILTAELKRKQAEKERLEQEKREIEAHAKQREEALAAAHQSKLEETKRKMDELDRKVKENERVKAELKRQEERINQLEKDNKDVEARADRLAQSLAAANQRTEVRRRSGGCFASTSSVFVQSFDGQITSKSLEDLQVGDLVESYDPESKSVVFSSVYYIIYNDDNETRSLLRRLYYEDVDGSVQSLALHPKHMVYANTLIRSSEGNLEDHPPPTPTMSEDVKLGDILWIKNASGHLCPKPVVKIDEVSSHVRHPLTFNHYIIVDGVLASVHMHNEWLLRQATGPLRVLYNVSPSLNDVWLTKKMVHSWDWIERYLLE